METELLRYFDGEKQGAIGFGLAGVIACLVGLVVWRSAAHYRAMLYPLLVVAAIQFGVCFVIYFRTAAQVDKLIEQLRRAPAEYKLAEGKRMTGVNRGFVVVEVVELVLFVGAVVICLVKQADARWFAVGLGLILQSSAMLVCDLAAHRRGVAYARAITELQP